MKWGLLKKEKIRWEGTKQEGKWDGAYQRKRRLDGKGLNNKESGNGLIKE